MEVNGQFQTPAALPQGKSCTYTLFRGSGGLQKPSGHCEEKYYSSRNQMHIFEFLAYRYTD
jgi:hypothetical protein